MVPVVRCENVLPVKSKFGTNYQPVLTLLRWVARPAELPARLAGNGASSGDTRQEAAKPAAQPSPNVPPPLNKLAQQATADDEEF
jgi:hypothetical protein